MLSIGSICAIASFLIDPRDRGFAIHRVILPATHAITRPFRRKKKNKKTTGTTP